MTPAHLDIDIDAGHMDIDENGAGSLGHGVGDYVGLRRALRDVGTLERPLAGNAPAQPSMKRDVRAVESKEHPPETKQQQAPDYGTPIGSDAPTRS